MRHQPVPQEGPSARLAASTAEVVAAIEALAVVDLQKLDLFGRKRVEMLGARMRGRDHHDLLQQAIADTLSGDRHWYKDVDFAHYLYWAMSSISDRWLKAAEEIVAEHPFDFCRPSLDGATALAGLDDIPSSSPTPETQYADHEELEAIARLLYDDAVALDAYTFMRHGLSGREIRDLMGLTQSAYDTITKRIYSKARRTIPR